jgi:hypothetical protein
MDEVFGNIDNPFLKFNSAYGDLKGGGLVDFMSNLIRLAIVAGGLYAFINLIIAGFQYISSNGDSKAVSAAWSRINMSLIGLIIMVSAFAVAGILGQLLLGDPTAILSPKIFGPGE